jgi:hypothetical protein
MIAPAQVLSKKVQVQLAYASLDGTIPFSYKAGIAVRNTCFVGSARLTCHP